MMTSRPGITFGEALVERLLPSGVLDSELPATPFDTPPEALDGAGCAQVRELLHFAVSSRTGQGLLLVLTGRDLAMPGFSSLFGFAEPALGVAVISTARFGTGDLAVHRLRKEIAHELGHLAGLGHCTTRGCAMSRARTVAELDVRESDACGKCPRLMRSRAHVLGTLALLALLILGTWGFEQAASVIAGPPFDAPFT